MTDIYKLPTELPPNGHPLRDLGARLVDLLQDDDFNNCEALLLAAIDELDRKDELCARLSHTLGTVSAERERLREALRYYAEGKHYDGDLENPSGAPENWLEPLCCNDTDVMVENGAMAAAALEWKP